jgi:Domain of unknown function (DUF4397)
MMLRRWFARLAAVTTLLGSVVACLATAPLAASAATGTAGTNDGWVRCANLSPGTPAVDIYLYAFGNPGHPTILRHANYGNVSSYMAVSAGEYTVAMRPVGATASSPPVVSTNFMVSAGSAYTVASIGSSGAQRALVLTDQMAAPKGQALVRVIQASVQKQQVTVDDGSDVLAQQLAFGSATSYLAVQPGTQTVQFMASGDKVSMPVTLAGGSVHTIVVLDGSAGLTVDILTDAAGSQVTPAGGAATGLGGTAPRDTVPSLIPWAGTLAAGLLLVAAGVIGLRRSRRTAAAGH